MKTSVPKAACSWLLSFLLCFSFMGGAAFAVEPEESAPAALEEGQASEPDASPDDAAPAPAVPDVEPDVATPPVAEAEPGLQGAQGQQAEERAGAATARTGASDENAPDEALEPAELEEGTYLLRTALAADKVVAVAGSGQGDATLAINAADMFAGQFFAVEVEAYGACRIVHEASGDVVTATRPEQGADVAVRPSDDSDAQRWIPVRDENGLYSFVSAEDQTLALDVAGASTADWTRIQLYETNGTNAQKFELIAEDPAVEPGAAIEDGVYLVKNAAAPSLVVDIPSSSLDRGVQAELFTNNATLNQLFYVSRNDEGFVTISSVNSGMNLDVSGSSLLSGTSVTQWQRFPENKNQQWALVQNDAGQYRIVSRVNGHALAAHDGVAANMAPLETRAVSDADASQLWTLERLDRVIADGVYTLVSLADSNQVLDVEGSSVEPVAPAELWDRHDTPNQKFSISWESIALSDIEGEGASGEGSPDIAEDASGIAQPAAVAEEEPSVEAVSITPLTGAGHYLSASEGGAVQFERYDSANRARQLWIPQGSGIGGVTFTNVATGMVLDAANGTVQKDASLVTAPASGAASQSFRPVGVDVLENGTYIVQCLSDDRVLEVEGGSRSDFAQVQAWTRHDGGNQKWVAEKLGGGYYRFTSARSKKAMDITGGVLQPQTKIEQFQVNGADAQRWRLAVNDDGSFTFYTVDPSLVLDVSDGGGYDGADAQLFAYNGTAGQCFRLIPTSYVPEDFQDLLGTFTTYSTNTWNGTYNMQKALDCFNGIVLQPGESMSFYGVTGRCGAAEGYLPAGVVGGIGYGGGICQASTTIYGAAIRAGFGIVDRQNHSVPSVYVPIGLDAMVSWGTSDLVVRNDTGNPVKILTYTYDNVLTCEIWGIQPDWYDYIEPVSWYTSSNSADAQRIYYKDGTVVYTEWLPSSYYW